MRLVTYRMGNFSRTGIVVGEYEHTWMGHVLMVRSATNIIKDQQFDNVPVNQAEPATLQDFLESVQRERNEITARLDDLIRQHTQVVAEQ